MSSKIKRDEFRCWQLTKNNVRGELNGRGSAKNKVQYNRQYSTIVQSSEANLKLSDQKLKLKVVALERSLSQFQI